VKQMEMGRWAATDGRRWQAVSPWDARRRFVRFADITWMPDELELAPDWVREEVVDASKDLRTWLSSQYPVSEEGGEPKRPRGGRRGRRPRE